MFGLRVSEFQSFRVAGFCGVRGLVFFVGFARVMRALCLRALTPAPFFGFGL